MNARVLVLGGAGYIGSVCVEELLNAGHAVTVFERRGSVAEETSFANAGVVAPGYVTPWAAPGMPAKVLRHLLSRHAPVRLAFLSRPFSSSSCPMFAQNAIISAPYVSLSQESNTEVSSPPEYANTIFMAAMMANFARTPSAKSDASRALTSTPAHSCFRG